jgi:two-component system, cell cycle response regulator
MKPKILIVDDSKTARLAAVTAFKSIDCQLLEAADGAEGLAVAAREKPDLLLLDVTMPGMEGPEMLARLKHHPELRDTPVLMLSSMADRATVLKIAKLGVTDYILKPFTDQVLLDRVSRIIALKPAADPNTEPNGSNAAVTLLVVDDKPAILEQIKQGLADTNWKIEGRAQASEALEFCSQTLLDAILVSLSLPAGAASWLCQTLRAGVRTRRLPVFALGVKNAVEELNRAERSGFAGVITKPLNFDELKDALSRTLHVDTLQKYFEQRDGALVLKLPPQLNSRLAGDIRRELPHKVAEAVDAGVDKVVLDFTELTAADVADTSFACLGLSAIQVSQELMVKHRFLGSELVAAESKKYAETKNWQFVNSFDEAVSAMNGAAPAAA